MLFDRRKLDAVELDGTTYLLLSYGEEECGGNCPAVAVQLNGENRYKLVGFTYNSLHGYTLLDQADKLDAEWLKEAKEDCLSFIDNQLAV